ncbi:MAG: AAA family ATPase, partial [Muribaculaceae bacterium]|nr:AAA family ATPase [Muribaculaceae bacterium]
SIEGGNDERIENIKISRGEESCFVWCVFFALIKEVIEVLGTAEPEDRSTRVFDNLKYIFIDDPVSSLDENHLIELAVNIAALAKCAPADLRFIITTHNPLFFNVLYNEFNNKDKSIGYKPKHFERKLLERIADGTYTIKEQGNDSPFAYHISLLKELEKAIESDTLRKYHYNFLRNILEKTATFLGYPTWTELLPTDDRQAYYNRIINLSSHGKHSGEEVPVLKSGDKQVLEFLVRRLKDDLKFNPDTIDKEDDH